MADIVVYEDSPLAHYLQEIQSEQHGMDLRHTAMPVHDPDPPPEPIGLRLAHNAADMFTHLVEYLTHTFSSSTSDTEDAEFEERFKYFICTSPFLNRAVTVHAHERGRRTDIPMTVEYTYKFNPGRFGYALGFGTLVTLVARSVLNRTRAGRISWLRPLLSRPTAVSLALASSAWILRILQRRNIQTTQNQALRSLQLLVNHCQSLDAKVNRAIMVIQEIELVSRGYRLSTPLAPISRIEQASKTRRCNIVRAQLVAALAKSGALFQRSTETLQSHIDHKRLSTLLDMYNVTPSPRPGSPGGGLDGESPITPWPHEHHHGFATPHGHDTNTVTENDRLILTSSPTSEQYPPLPSSFSNHIRQNSLSKRRSRTMTGSSRQNSRPSSRHGHNNIYQLNIDDSLHASDKRTSRRHHTLWSASEGEDSDNGTASATISPRTSTYSTNNNNPNGSPTLTGGSLEMTSLEQLRKNFQRMHCQRREFLCELLSIRRKSRKGRQGLNALKDYDQNWTVVRDVLHEGVVGIESVVDELSKVLDSELYTLPRIDTQSTKGGNTVQDKQLQPFVQRLALLEHHVRGVQAKLFICNEDIKETIKQEPADAEKRQLLELQFDSISQDISMMATEWQLGKMALNNVFEPSPARSMAEEQGKHDNNLDGSDRNDCDGTHGIMIPVTDSVEHFEDPQHLMYLASMREETWEASTETEAGGSGDISRRAGFVGSDGMKMTRAERIKQQKLLREQEEFRKEQAYDSTKMVHELKDVLGRRRHLRENDGDQQRPVLPVASSERLISTAAPPQSSSTLSSPLPSPSPSASSPLYNPSTAGYFLTTQMRKVDGDLQQLSLEQELLSPSSSSSSSPIPLPHHISSLTINTFGAINGTNSFTKTLEQELAGKIEDSFVEISGMGEASEEEEATEEDVVRS
ncbi:hypothetical protein BX616_001793 [Lobosporangium transversale]|uniref:Vezatin n=1 Tax=Lobosporangium transversale TaxID=64571 RepID=A0A1Y2GKZ5_9FUNG|nr:Mysoin-binding motif of peroxisomes-domain-containing protein [Lobosporangium transversale]KAF9917152.1 hypothetical protein BX616_001793 [Lobosporangium transversale]ORZ12916.1 Mysoin-binding motif of peroxisomes-domain-containing protein [Lobosporangium transversale]|eukprot:XP_021880265.1 Mysoin-binding motif of peroxisomes-domain-containing protein [Lobosporangium transversale]